MSRVVSSIAKLDEQQIQPPYLSNDLLERLIRPGRIRLQESLREQDAAFALTTESQKSLSIPSIGTFTATLLTFFESSPRRGSPAAPI